jgi:hypothetical protein
VEVHATPGRKLSDELQDGQSYRYGIVSLGGSDLADVLQRFAVCKHELGIVLKPLDWEAVRDNSTPAAFAPSGLAQVLA